MEHRDFIVGNRRGYVLRNKRIVIEIGDTDYSMTIADAVSLGTLLDLLLRDAGARPPVWMHVLAHNLYNAACACAAFRQGRVWQAEYLTAQWNGGGWTYPFEPGCGRSEP